MPVPVCPDSYFQSAALKHIWMSQYFWPASTATGKSKHYCPVHPLHSIDCTGVFCMGCILFLLRSYPLFSIFIREHSYSARKGSPIPARHVWFFPSVKKHLCIVAYWANGEYLVLAIWFFKFYSSVPEMLKQFCIQEWVLTFGSWSQGSPIHVCLFMFACNRGNFTTSHSTIYTILEECYRHPQAETAWY